MQPGLANVADLIIHEHEAESVSAVTGRRVYTYIFSSRRTVNPDPLLAEQHHGTQRIAASCISGIDDEPVKHILRKHRILLREEASLHSKNKQNEEEGFYSNRLRCTEYIFPIPLHKLI